MHVLFSFRVCPMPSRRKASGVETGRVSFRDAPDTVRFYKKQAQVRGITFSEYARRLAERGAFTESIESLIKSVDACTARAQNVVDAANALAKPSGSGPAGVLSIDLIRAIFHCQFLLDEIVTRNDMSATIRAKDAAERLAAELVRSAR
ncbi:hypothetical protein DF021_34640 [Burkholderia stagnalis]|uniref:Uncharacterized protein n=2 Tax=Burkholderia stagnalis TaxID=1503054 RepID=A0ABX9YC94_9BURK|nr:hypothetical protein DF158_34705 [Burkholderia stagnalis]RQQ58600.1 hypothetical protein DF139_35120 [Burkholderia stagnalis]RQQ58617.1 hypothetical protein DF137_35050 [Burkholderia stagnalis]RQQ72528.1 hypothetical protein DF138_34885 [Burkholderia stagnalis]RQQ78888.1 hypothetical protein DF134_35270 [Burkholderia stagnalis]